MTSREEQPLDASALDALVLLLRFHEIAVDPAQIRHQFGAAFGLPEILRCAKQFKLKARALNTDWERLTRTPLPALAECRDGAFIIVGKVVDDKVLIHDPRRGPPDLLSPRQRGPPAPPRLHPFRPA